MRRGSVSRTNRSPPTTIPLLLDHTSGERHKASVHRSSMVEADTSRRHCGGYGDGGCVGGHRLVVLAGTEPGAADRAVLAHAARRAAVDRSRSRNRGVTVRDPNRVHRRPAPVAPVPRGSRRARNCGGRADANCRPCFSPDGLSVAFFQRGNGVGDLRLKRVGVNGGIPVTLAPFPLMGIGWPSSRITREDRKSTSNDFRNWATGRRFPTAVAWRRGGPQMVVHRFISAATAAVSLRCPF